MSSQPDICLIDSSITASKPVSKDVLILGIVWFFIVVILIFYLIYKNITWYGDPSKILLPKWSPKGKTLFYIWAIFAIIFGWCWYRGVHTISSWYFAIAFFLVLVIALSMFYFHNASMTKIMAVITVLYFAYLSWILWKKENTHVSIGVAICNIGLILFTYMIFKSEVDLCSDDE